MKHSVISFLPGTALAAGLGLFLLLPGTSTAADTTALQGTWRGTRYSEGKGDDPSKGVALELTFKDNHVNGKRLPEEKPVGEGEVKISEDGKCMDGTNTKGKVCPGIFKIDGDTLLWCVTTTGNAEDRPKDFVAEPGKKSYLIIVKRQKS